MSKTFVDRDGTILRTLFILKQLMNPGGLVIKEMAGKQNVSERTIQRCIEYIKDAGFEIVKQGNRYHTQIKKTWEKDIPYIGGVLAFKTRDDVNENEIKKLLENDIIISDPIPDQYGYFSKAISNAIQFKTQLSIVRYSFWSNLSNQKINVEPVSLDTENELFWAYVPSSGKNEMISFAEIRDMYPTMTGFKHEQIHRSGGFDVFYGKGFTSYPIELEMNEKAYQILSDEFPRAASYGVKLNENLFSLKTQIYNFRNVLRYLLKASPGYLPGQGIKITEGKEFLEYLELIKSKAPRLFKRRTTYSADELELIDE